MTEDWKQPVLSESQVRDLDAILVAFVFGNHGLAPLADGHANVSIEHLERFLDYAGVLAEYGQNIGMPRRVADYADRFADINLVISIASFVLGVSVVLFFYNIIVSWARGPIAESNPWRAMTLEWQVSSPPPVFNFDELPTVVGGPYEYGVPGARHAVLAGSGQLQEAHV